jgi:hypothetical protein
MADPQLATDSPSGTDPASRPLTAGEWRDALVQSGMTFGDVTATYRTWDDLHTLTPTDERTETDG